jgi:hypothetical protein
LYDACWLTDRASLPELLDGLRVANSPALGGFICQYYHTALAGRLPKTRYLIEQQVPFAAEFSEYLLAIDRRNHGRPKEWLHHLTQQIHEAQPEDVDYFFTEMAATLQHQLVVRTESKTFRITELEFYYHSRNHPDPYVHKGAEQLKHLHWYFNQATSLDLTFGDRDTNSYGGILLRGLQLLSTDPADEVTPAYPYLMGPQLLTRALVASWGSALHGATYLGLDENPAPTEIPASAWRTARVGLSSKRDPTCRGPIASWPTRAIYPISTTRRKFASSSAWTRTRFAASWATSRAGCECVQPGYPLLLGRYPRPAASGNRYRSHGRVAQQRRRCGYPFRYP